MPRKKEVDGGLPSPNCFIVPIDILQVIKKLNKDEIICLLNMLAGKQVDYLSDAFAGLQSYGICDLMGDLVWNKPEITHIRLVKSSKAYTIKVDEDASPKDPQAFMDQLPSRVSSLWAYQSNWLKQKNYPITDAHIIKWVQEMMDLSSQPHFLEAVEHCHKSGLGSYKIVKQIMDQMNQDQSSWGSLGS